MAIEPSPQFEDKPKKSKQTFFHASDHLFDVGDHIEPRDTYSIGSDDPVAHATNDHIMAKNYGRWVYEVEPLDKPEVVSSRGKSKNFISRKGFIVKRVL